jgi:hypothetical protein
VFSIEKGVFNAACLKCGTNFIHIHYLRICPLLVGVSEYERSSSKKWRPFKWNPENEMVIFFRNGSSDLIKFQ